MTPGILALDIGGTGLKTAVINARGKMLSERLRVPTPQPCPPAALIAAVAKLVQPLPPYNRISIGFPGVIRHQTVLTAPNLDTRLWAGFKLAAALSKKLGGHPARIVNDAEMQGLALIRGKGLELVVTLGTGVGTALFRDGQSMPHMELAHHPLHGDKTYDGYLGDAELKRVGKKRWNKRIRFTLGVLDVLLHPEHIVLVGGNARRVQIELPPCVRVCSDAIGIEGGAFLWSKDRRTLP